MRVRRDQEAYTHLFVGLVWLSHRLAGRRYLVGDTITAAQPAHNPPPALL